MILLIIAGPNDAGKTTIAEPLLHEIGMEEYINADQIARGLSMLHPERSAFKAGRIALDRMDQPDLLAYKKKQLTVFDETYYAYQNKVTR